MQTDDHSTEIEPCSDAITGALGDAVTRERAWVLATLLDLASPLGMWQYPDDTPWPEPEASLLVAADEAMTSLEAPCHLPAGAAMRLRQAIRWAARRLEGRHA